MLSLGGTASTVLNFNCGSLSLYRIVVTRQLEHVEPRGVLCYCTLKLRVVHLLNREGGRLSASFLIRETGKYADSLISNSNMCVK